MEIFLIALTVILKVALIAAVVFLVWKMGYNKGRKSQKTKQ